MSIIGMVVMWAFTFVVFTVLTRWPMGMIYEKRKEYWARYEG